MIDTPGRCGEVDYCSIGQMRTVVRVIAGQPFVCPECGRPLRQVADGPAGFSRARLAMLAGGAALGLAGLIVWLSQPAPKRHFALTTAAPMRAPAQALPAKAPPVPAYSQPAAPIDVPPRPPAQAPVAQAPVAPAKVAAAKVAPASGPAPLSPPARTTQPVPPPVPARALASVPRTLAKVRMECSIDAAGVPSNCVPITDTVPPGTQPASGARPPASPTPPAKPPPQPVPRRPAPALPPVVQEREASIVPIGGGGPPYPTDYVRDGRAGEVSVECLIGEDGDPSHCKVRDVLGGRRFAEATVNWLNSGQVRFAPAIHDGHAVAEERHWRIAFPSR